MVQVTAEEAKTKLPDLIAAAIEGEAVFITQDGQQIVQLTPITPSSKGKRKAGSAKGLIHMADDFDAPDESVGEDPFLAAIGTLSMGPITSEEIDLELYGAITVEMNEDSRAKHNEE